MPKQSLEDLKKRREQLDAKIQMVEAKEIAKQKKEDTRRKILIGAYFLQKYENDNNMEELSKQLDPFLTRKNDRKLFGLPITENETKETELAPA